MISIKSGCRNGFMGVFRRQSEMSLKKNAVLPQTQKRGYREIQEHKVCVVTGASRGIGYATAKVCH